MKTYAEMIASLNQIRNDAMASIKEYMEAHAGKVADFVENGGYIPTIFNCATCDDEIAVCDRIYIENECVYVDYSNSYENYTCELGEVPTEALLNIIDCLDERLFESEN